MLSTRKIIIAIAMLISLLTILAVSNYIQHHSTSWKRMSGMKQPRSEASVVAFQGDLFVFNGFGPKIKIENSVERYNRKTRRWQIISKTSVSQGTAITHNGLVSVNGEAWLIGGRVGDHPGPVTDKVWIFNLTTYQWRQGPTLPQPGGGGGAALVDKKIHWFGGIDENANCDVDSHFVYDLLAPEEGWLDITENAAMPVPRNHFSTVVIDEKIYAIGGQFGHDRCPGKRAIDTRFVHAFDPKKNTWQRLADLPFVQSHNEAGSFAHNGFIYSVGGEINGNLVMRFDPLANHWREIIELPHALLGTVSRIINGRLMVAGGGAPNTWNPTNKSHDTRLSFIAGQPDDLCSAPAKRSTNATEKIGSTLQAADFNAKTPDRDSTAWKIVHSSDRSAPDARHEAGAVLVGNKIYLLGGRHDEGVEAFDLDKMHWVSIGPTPKPFHHFQPVAIDEEIYVAGAFSGKFPSESPVTSVYSLNTQDGSWSVRSVIPESRLRGSAAAVVHDGKLYLIGGNRVGHKGPSVTWFDEYDPASDTWKTLPDAPHARDHATAAIANGKLVVAGGRQSTLPNVFDSTVSETDVFNFSTRQWETGADDIPTARAGSMSVTLGSEVIVIGGETADNQLAHKNVEAIDIESGTWRTLPELNIGRHSGGAIATKNSIHVVSGNARRGGGHEISCHEVYRLR